MSGPQKLPGENEKRGINRRRWLQALGVGGAAGMAGCTSGDDTDTETGTGTDEDAFGGDTATATERAELPEVSGTYRPVTGNPAQTLNPLYNTENGAGTLIGYALDQGYTFAPGNERVPQLFDLTTDNGEVWVGELRDNLQFSDPYGQVTAEDFVYMVQELHKSDWAGTAAAAAWAGEVSIEQTGELEFQIELPNANLLYPETYDPLMYPIPKDLVQPYVEEEDATGLQENQELLELSFAGNLGAYTLDEWNRSQGQTYSRNEDYYLREHTDDNALFENAPYFESLENTVVQEQASRLGALETGEADVASIPPERVQEFQNLDRVDVSIQPTPYNRIISYNMRDNGWNAGEGNLFRNKKFRQGLGCAVDKEAVVTGIFRGYADPEFTWQPRWSRWYPGDEDLMQFGVGDLYGEEAAHSRIEEALSEIDEDYSYDSNGRLLNPDGDQVTLSLYHSSGSSTEESFAQFIAQEYEDNAGIAVEPQAIQGAQFGREYWQQQIPENPDQYEWSEGASNAGPREVTSANAWDMSIVYGLNTYPLNPTTGSIFFIKDSYYNPYGYYPEWNAKELFDQASSAGSTEELQEIMNEIFRKIAEHQPLGMLVFTSDTIGYSANIEGPADNFFNGWDFPAWYRTDE